MIWELLQTIFMLGTVVTVMVNTSSIKFNTRRIEELEDDQERRG